MGTATASELLVALLRAIERNDLVAIGGLFHPDGRFETPYTPGDDPVTEGRNAIVALLKGVGEDMFAKVAFTVEREYPCADPSVAVAEYRSLATLRGGATYANHYITVCEARDGQITLFREYFNPRAVMKALGGA